MLRISEASRQAIVDEFRYVVDQMRQVAAPADQLYFLSAAWGIIHRVFNSEYDPELVFAHQVLSLTHSQIASRHADPQVAALSVMRHSTYGLIDLLETKLLELADAWAEGLDATEILRDIAVIGYAATGNGNYLIIKGDLNL